MKAAPRRRLQTLALLSILMLFAMRLFPAASEAVSHRTVTVYFPNWNVYASGDDQVKNLPWPKIDCICHAFWKIVPASDSYAVASTDAWADTDPENPQAHFAQYARYAKEYPETEILLSIGGWNCSGCFSQMAATAAGRASFIQSCVDILGRYPFFTGLDIDWEYPGVARKGGGGNEGNPVMGDDAANYPLLLRELRAALDAEFGKGSKMLTVCAPGSASLLARQDWAALYPDVDRIHLMTYDLAGESDGRTGHHAALYGGESADTAVKYLLGQGVPAAKIIIGAPLYSHGWQFSDIGGEVVGAPARGLSDGVMLWKELKALENSAVPEGTPGWHTGYDENSQAAYLWNDDPASESYKYFYSYENERALDAKLQYVFVHGLGGIMVWQSGGDDASAGWPMITRMHRALHR